MSEIVATIQAEQDAVIRADLPGVLVVQGGPGFGKTVVALHRAAYLLYTHRDQLARRGVLVVGPNATFLRYIEQVLPSLGETEVVLSTINQLLPGVVGTAAESPDAGRIKGKLQMADVIARAVRAVRAVRREQTGIDNGGGTSRPKVSSLCSGRPRSDWPPPHRSSPPLSAPPCTAGPKLPGPGPTWRCSTRRPNCSATPRRKCGGDAGRRQGAPVRTPSIWLTPARWFTAGLAADQLTIDPLDVEPFIRLMAERTRHRDEPGTIAERAAADRSWQFGHVIVDEAQELTPMEWRMLMRRCWRRSMTLVGDLDQAGRNGGVRSWSELLEHYAPGRWCSAELTVNYRTPAEVMAVAADVLTAINPAASPPVSARSTGVVPWSRCVSADQLSQALVEAVAAEQALIGDGRLAVIVPGSRHAELAALVSAALPGVAHGSDPALLDAATAILEVDQSKGLEFDSVLIADPGAILRESRRGGSDLYVAVTRATQRLGVITDGSLPNVLHRLRAVRKEVGSR